MVGWGYKPTCNQWPQGGVGTAVPRRQFCQKWNILESGLVTPHIAMVGYTPHLARSHKKFVIYLLLRILLIVDHINGSL